MKISKIILLSIFAINFKYASAFAWRSDFVERSYNDRGEDLDSTFIQAIGKCEVVYAHDSDGDPQYYRYCFSVTYERAQNQCTGFIDPNGRAHVWGNHSRSFWTQPYCTESAAVYNNEGRSLSQLCKNWTADARDLMKSSEERNRRKHKCQ